MNTETIAPPAAAPEPSGFQVSSLFGGDSPAPATPAADPSASPDSTPAPSGPSSVEDMMASIMGNRPAAATPATAPTTEADFWKSWMKENYPEAPEGIAKVDNWKASRDINTKLIASLAAKETELAAAMKERAAVKADGGAALPETEAVQKLSLELAAFKTKYDTELGEYQRSKAAAELQGNHAFRQEHDARRAALFEEAKEVADEVNLDEDTLKAIFDADTEYKMAKALADVDDETAAVPDPAEGQ